MTNLLLCDIFGGSLKGPRKTEEGGGGKEANRNKGKPFLDTGNLGVSWFINIYKVKCGNKCKR
jgi:hypothetical protein